MAPRLRKNDRWSKGPVRIALSFGWFETARARLESEVEIRITITTDGLTGLAGRRPECRKDLVRG
jgi:hypothetical protein